MEFVDAIAVARETPCDPLLRVAIEVILDECHRARRWVACPQHGPFCGGDECCCADEHQPELAT